MTYKMCLFLFLADHLKHDSNNTNPVLTCALKSPDYCSVASTSRFLIISLRSSDGGLWLDCHPLKGL